MKSARQRMSDRIGRFDILATQEFLVRLQKEKSVRKGTIEAGVSAYVWTRARN
jgi:hypothetical protein